MIRVALRLFAGRKTAVVVAVQNGNARLPVFKCPAETLLAGDVIDFDQPQDWMQTLPAWLGCLKKLLSLHCRLQIVAGQWLAVVAKRGKFIHQLERQVEITPV